MTTRLTANETKILADFRRDCCDRSKAIGAEQDWFSLSLGYFIAKGVKPVRAHALACVARYTFHYWIGQ